MTASQLIEKLNYMIAQHGDLPIVVEDGLDPSDLVVAEDVVYRTGDDRYVWHIRSLTEYLEIH